MAYNPPHRRHSKDTNSTTPFPTLLSSPYPYSSPSAFQSLHQRNIKHVQKAAEREPNTYPRAIYAWLVVPFDDEDNTRDVKLPSSIILKEFPCELMAPRQFNKSMILVSTDNHEIINKNPAMTVVSKLRNMLLGSFEKARNEMRGDNVQNVPYVLFRFGKLLFHERKSFSISFDNIYKSSIVEAALSQFERSFYTSVPISFGEIIIGEVTQKVGLVFEKETEYYSLKVHDRDQGNTVTCKCTVSQDIGGLQLQKANFCIVTKSSLSANIKISTFFWCILYVDKGDQRRFVADISCLDKNLDLRLRLSSKKILTLPASEMVSLMDLLKSAVIDSEATGGLRWPLGNKSVDGRYSIVRVSHSKNRVFRNSLMKLKVRRADRFDLQTETNEVTDEVTLTMTELNRMLRDLTLEVNPMVDVVGHAMSLIWDYFLCWEGSFI